MLVACGGGGIVAESVPATGSPGSAPAATLGDTAFAAALAASGVTIVDRPDGDVVVAAAEPAGPLTVTVYQVDALAALARAGNGILPADLDAAVGEPVPGAPMSQMIVDHITAGESEAARWVAAVQSAQSPISAAAILVFIADLVRQTGPQALSRPNAGDLVQPTGLAALSRPRVVDVGLAAGASAALLHAPQVVVPPDCAFPLLLWVTSVLDKLYTAAPGADANPIWEAWAQHLADALVVLGALALVAPVIAGWTVSLQATPPSDRYAVGAEPDRPQLFTAKLSPLSIPEEQAACANAAGLQLPDSSGINSTATWTLLGVPPHGTELSRDDSFDSSGNADLAWVTAREETDDGPEETAVVTATVEVNAAYRQLMIKAFEAAVKNAVFPPEQTYLQALLGDKLSEITAAVSKLTTANATATITFHAEKACVTGEWVSAAYLAPGQEVQGGAGTMHVSVADPGHASVKFDPDAAVFARVPGVEQWTMFEFSGGYTAVFQADGKMTGGASGNAKWSAYVDLGGPVPVFEDQPLDGSGGTTNTYTCNGDELVIQSSMGTGFLLHRAG
jgi:hypothetical protein